jgi:hypothetical protein
MQNPATNASLPIIFHESDSAAGGLREEFAAS